MDLNEASDERILMDYQFHKRGVDTEKKPWKFPMMFCKPVREEVYGTTSSMI